MGNIKKSITALILVGILFILIGCSKDPAKKIVSESTKAVAGAPATVKVKTAPSPILKENPDKAYIEKMMAADEDMNQNMTNPDAVPDTFVRTSPSFSLSNIIIDLKKTPTNATSHGFLDSKITFEGIEYTVGYYNKHNLIETHTMVVALKPDKSWKFISDVKIK